MGVLSMCGSKTHIKIRSDTELTNFPLYFPKCKSEALIKAKDLQVSIIKEPGA
ncbi:conjugal transfer protein [bacterium D16-76]|nr:conjugal transfer protein [bacterium D16-76]